MKQPETRHLAFTLIELLMVLAVMGILLGAGIPGVRAVRKGLARMETKALFGEIETAFRMVRLEHGGWPQEYPVGELDFNIQGQAWRERIALQMERRATNRIMVDGFGNTAIHLVIDEGDHWIRSSDFKALAPGDRPDDIWGRVAVYSLDGEGRLAAASWKD